MNNIFNKNYFKLFLYIVLTFAAIYTVRLCLTGIAYTLANATDVIGDLRRLCKHIATVFAPVIIALVLYVLLESPLLSINRKIKNRRLACVLLFAAIALVPCTLMGITALQLYRNGISNISETVQLQFSSLYKYIDGLLTDLGLDKFLMPHINRFLRNFSLTSEAVNRLIHLISTSAINLALGTVMAFYLLIRENPFDTAKHTLHTILPPQAYRLLRILVDICREVLNGYVLGQLSDAVIMTVLIGIGLSIIKIPFAVFIGICAGFSNIIPYFGAIVGFGLTIAAGIISGSTVRTILGAAIMLALQQLDSAVIVPRIVGKRVEVGPFGVIAALSVGGRAFGLWGMVLSVPTVAVCKMLITRLYTEKQKSP
jgi:predicted PurR-regulated permease PerM